MVEHAAVAAGDDRLVIAAAVGAVPVEHEAGLAEHGLGRADFLAGVAGHEAGLAEEGQAAADNNGQCAPIYWNNRQHGWYTKVCPDHWESKPRYMSIDAGEVYSFVSVEDADRLAKEKLDEEAEEAYRKELKARCERKGLDYEEELERHLATVQEKRAKEALKEEKAAAKAAQKKEKAKAKEEARLASMSEEKRASYEERKAKKAAREEASWEKEKERGEASYRKMKEELARYEAR